MTTPYDDQRVKNEHRLVRRINPRWHLKPDKARGGGYLQPNSVAFKASDGPNEGMSVYWFECLQKNGHDPMTYGETSEYTGAMVLTVGDVRALGLAVGHTPVDGNECHVDIWNITGKNQAEQFHRGKHTEALIGKAVWLAKPEGYKV